MLSVHIGYVRYDVSRVPPESQCDPIAQRWLFVLWNPKQVNGYIILHVPIGGTGYQMMYKKISF